jgi:hypothetical protein
MRVARYILYLKEMFEYFLLHSDGIKTTLTIECIIENYRF